MMTVHGTRLSPPRFHRYLEERVRGGVGLVGLSAMIGLYDFPLGPGRFLVRVRGRSSIGTQRFCLRHTRVPTRWWQAAEKVRSSRMLTEIVSSISMPVSQWYLRATAIPKS